MKFYIETSFSDPASAKYRAYIRKVAHETLLQVPQSVQRKLLTSHSEWTLEIAVIGKAQMQKINFQFRKKNRPTDVLSFSNIEKGTTVVPIIGEVILCWPILKAQAKEYGVTLKQEIARMLAHGILHLFGYDHELSKSEERRMFRLQEKILNKIVGKNEI